MHDEDDGIGVMAAILFPLLPVGIKFTSTMLQMLILKGLFSGVIGDNTNQYLINIVAICQLSNIPSIISRLFI